jgi:hypothetical protein
LDEEDDEDEQLKREEEQGQEEDDNIYSDDMCESGKISHFGQKTRCPSRTRACLNISARSF